VSHDVSLTNGFKAALQKKKTYMYRYVFVYLSVNKAANKLRKHIFIQIFGTIL